MSAWVEKDPQDKRDFGLDWTNLLPEADTIVTAVWTAPTGITKEVSPPPDIIGKITTVWLSSGRAGSLYDVPCHITTAAGRELDGTLPVLVKHR